MSDTTVQNEAIPEKPLTVKSTNVEISSEEVVVVGSENTENPLTVNYKEEYTTLLLNTALKDSKALQALDLPQDIAIDYFKKYFTVEEEKGKLVIVGKFQDAKLVDKEGKPVAVNEAIKHIIANNKELSTQAAKKAPTYKGSLGVVAVNLKTMSVAEKVAYRKQVGPSVYRSILEKQ